jgi:uncharacterized peroxidase-related enzyme
MAHLGLKDSSDASPDTRAVLQKAQSQLGKMPNMVRAMANSPVVAEIYLLIAETLAKGRLTPQMRELLALAAAGTNDCDYCIRAHAAKGRKAGLEPEQMTMATACESHDPKTATALNFAREILESRGAKPTMGIVALKEAGWLEEEIAEIIAVVTLNIFPNYFNKLVGTEVDFPEFKR